MNASHDTLFAEKSILPGLESLCGKKHYFLSRTNLLMPMQWLPVLWHFLAYSYAIEKQKGENYETTEYKKLVSNHRQQFSSHMSV